MLIDQPLMANPQPIDLASLLAGSLAASYGSSTLANGIQAAMDQARMMVLAGHNEEHLTTNTGLRVFASEAGGCSRAIGLRMLDLAPMDLTPELQTTFLIGDLLHGALQSALTNHYPGFKAEERWYQDHISGRADGLYHLDSYKTVLEIKSCSKSGFSYALWKGPKATHILQAALSALVLGAEQLHIIYISKTPVSKPKALASRNDLPAQLSIFDWFLDLDREAAQEEYDRLSQVAKDVAAGTLPDRITAFEFIDDPSLFKFPCGWCKSKKLCIQLGPGVQPISRLLELHPQHQFPQLALS